MAVRNYCKMLALFLLLGIPGDFRYSVFPVISKNTFDILKRVPTFRKP